MANVTAKWEHGLTFSATSPRGYTVPLSADPSVGGDADGFGPMEMILIGLAGCTGIDTLSILRKKRQDVTGFTLQITGETSGEHPKVYTRIHVEYRVRGNAINAEAVARAIELSVTKYCPVQAMLVHSVQMTHSYVIEGEVA